MTTDAERGMLTRLIESFENPTIVELGAHEGQDTLWMAACCKGVPDIVMVEADFHNFTRLPEIPWAIRIHAAIAGHDGMCEFWSSRSHGGGYGSIYKPAEGLSVPLAEFEKPYKVPCFTFDSLCDWLHIDKIDLLYVDIHGAEKDMIAHGQRALSRTRWLYMEAFKTRCYEGMATQDELLAMLPGWEFVEQFDWNILLRNKSCL